MYSGSTILCSVLLYVHLPCITWMSINVLEIGGRRLFRRLDGQAGYSPTMLDDVDESFVTRIGAIRPVLRVFEPNHHHAGGPLQNVSKLLSLHLSIKAGASARSTEKRHLWRGVDLKTLFSS